MKPWLMLGALLLAGAAAELLVGPTGFGWPSDPFVTWQLRVPRLLLALSAGAGLSACGLMLQVLLRNPLASPYTLGVGSGAALGAAVVLTLGVEVPNLAFATVAVPITVVVVLAGFTWRVERTSAVLLALGTLVIAVTLGHSPASTLVGIAAWTGAFVVTFLVLTISRSTGLNSETLVLVGVAVALCASAGVLLLHFLADQATSAAMIRWTMGGLSTMGLNESLGALAVSVLGVVWLIPLLPQLNLLQLGDDWAESRGVHVVGLSAVILLAVAQWTGSIVAVAGPISFIGLIAPHMARRLVGDDLRLAAPAALLMGAGLLAFCDAIARVVMMPAEVPVGVLTALLGGPAFLALLLWRRR